eukprot:4863104-Amphidinium_carterae.1
MHNNCHYVISSTDAFYDACVCWLLPLVLTVLTSKQYLHAYLHQTSNMLGCGAIDTKTNDITAANYRQQTCFKRLSTVYLATSD